MQNINQIGKTGQKNPGGWKLDNWVEKETRKSESQRDYEQGRIVVQKEIADTKTITKPIEDITKQIKISTDSFKELGTVLKVIDADTADVFTDAGIKKRIRILGIDAFENDTPSGA